MMLQAQLHDAVLELRMARPPVNALDPALVTALREAIAAAPGQGARGIMLCGRIGMFSAGLDVPVLLQLSRPRLVAFWRDFFALCAALAESPLPVAAAIAGHCPAGGAVLSLFCDYRVMACSDDVQKPYRIGLNEVQVGLTVPETIQQALRRTVGARRAERMMVVGQMLLPEEARAIDLVDELAASDQVEARAAEWLSRVLAMPPQAMAQTRRLARADLARLFADPDAFGVEAFADAWFGRETQDTLAALLARLKKS